MGFERLPLNSKLTKETCKAICGEVSRGVPYKYACMGVGIAPSTVNKWRNLGKESDDPDDPYRMFYLAFEKAKAGAVIYRVEAIRKAGEGGTWTAHAWWLERMAHDEFGKKSVIDANVNANVNQINLSELFDKEQLLNILKEEDTEEE